MEGNFFYRKTYSSGHEYESYNCAYNKKCSPVSLSMHQCENLSYIKYFHIEYVILILVFDALFLFVYVATGDGDNILRFCPCFHVIQLMKNVSIFKISNAFPPFFL